MSERKLRQLLRANGYYLEKVRGQRYYHIRRESTKAIIFDWLRGWQVEAEVLKLCT